MQLEELLLVINRCSEVLIEAFGFHVSHNILLVILVLLDKIKIELLICNLAIGLLIKHYV